MSFSQEVKEELSKLNNLANKKEVLYEFYGYLSSKNISEEGKFIKYSTESDYNIDRLAKLLRNIGIEDFDITINGNMFVIKFEKKLKINNINLEETTTTKAFMRGLFMGAGSINNPEKTYHLECNLKNIEQVTYIIPIMRENEIHLKQRENTVYIKEGEEISKFLAFIGATKSVLKFEEIRVQRYMNNKVNRLVNCETANLNKVLNASVKQVNAIRKLKQNGMFEKLDNNLKEIAELRLENPDMSLVELGKKLSTPIGKSGVNYRLNKIIKLAEEML